MKRYVLEHKGNKAVVEVRPDGFFHTYLENNDGGRSRMEWFTSLRQAKEAPRRVVRPTE